MLVTTLKVEEAARVTSEAARCPPLLRQNLNDNQVSLCYSKAMVISGMGVFLGTPFVEHTVCYLSLANIFLS
jgi:hypothetical protein